MNRTRIEWVRSPDGTQGYTWNPITGCSGCEILDRCYARQLATTRLKGRYGYLTAVPFRPTFHLDRLQEPLHRKGASGIFVCSMGELFDTQNHPDHVLAVMDVFYKTPHHRFYVLTKQPDVIPLHNCFRFPSNVWLGVSVTGQRTTWRIDSLRRIESPGVRFVSFEPLLEDVGPDLDLYDLRWVIIGGLTGPKPQRPAVPWVKHILEACDDQGVPVFVKDNAGWLETIREFPRGRSP